MSSRQQYLQFVPSPSNTSSIQPGQSLSSSYPSSTHSPLSTSMSTSHQSSERSGWAADPATHQVNPSQHPAISQTGGDPTLDGLESVSRVDGSSHPQPTDGLVSSPMGSVEPTVSEQLVDASFEAADPPPVATAGAAPYNTSYQPPGSPFSSHPPNPQSQYTPHHSHQQQQHQQHQHQQQQQQQQHHLPASTSSSQQPSNAPSPAAQHHMVYNQPVGYHMLPQYQPGYQTHHAPPPNTYGYYANPLPHPQAMHVQQPVASRSGYSSPHLHHPFYPGSPPNQAYTTYPAHFAPAPSNQMHPPSYQYIAFAPQQGYRSSHGILPGSSSHPSPSIHDHPHEMDPVERHSPLSYDPTGVDVHSHTHGVVPQDDLSTSVKRVKPSKKMMPLEDALIDDHSIKDDADYGPYDTLPDPTSLQTSQEFDQEDGDDGDMLTVGKMGSKRKRSSDPGGSKEKKHVCPECHRGFARAYNLKTHVQTHSPDPPKPHVCNYDSCGNKAFSRSHDLLRHKGSVHGEGRQSKMHSDPGRATNGKRKKSETLRIQREAVDNYERIAAVAAAAAAASTASGSGTSVLDEGGLSEAGSLGGDGLIDPQGVSGPEGHDPIVHHSGTMDGNQITSELGGYSATIQDQADYQQQIHLRLQMQLQHEHHRMQLEAVQAAQAQSDVQTYAQDASQVEEEQDNPTAVTAHLVDPQLEADLPQVSIPQDIGLLSENGEASNIPSDLSRDLISSPSVEPRSTELVEVIENPIENVEQESEAVTEKTPEEEDAPAVMSPETLASDRKPTTEEDKQATSSPLTSPETKVEKVAVISVSSGLKADLVEDGSNHEETDGTNGVSDKDIKTEYLEEKEDEEERRVEEGAVKKDDPITSVSIDDIKEE
ncbi:FOG: Zn-finger [Phaffia rhodozyma]|uniref:FOG: Zn-finger n=1 Tax=Phaffia rhodozyma TaxID=264483 RepID=A0A0F7SJD0_PHARH|nr:FOG: Zn-finger [Phaffia rhodozyma]